MGHIPPGRAETIRTGVTSDHPSYTDRNNKRYLNLIRNYTHLIAGQFFGHLHTDAFRVMYDENGKFINNLKKYIYSLFSTIFIFKQYNDAKNR